MQVGKPGFRLRLGQRHLNVPAQCLLDVAQGLGVRVAAPFLLRPPLRAFLLRLVHLLVEVRVRAQHALPQVLHNRRVHARALPGTLFASDSSVKLAKRLLSADARVEFRQTRYRQLLQVLEKHAEQTVALFVAKCAPLRPVLGLLPGVERVVRPAVVQLFLRVILREVPDHSLAEVVVRNLTAQRDVPPKREVECQFGAEFRVLFLQKQQNEEVHERER